MPLRGERTVTGLFFIAISLAGAVQAENWPRFRGPDGSGVASSARPPVDFGPAKNLAWKVAVPSGHSSPIVCDGRLYLTSFDKYSLKTHAFDAESGRELWHRDVSRTRSAKHHSLNNAASPSPVCDSGGVVVFFADFGLAAYAPDGERQWASPQPPVVNNHGLASSPILSGKNVIQVVAGNSGSTVLAVARSTGKQVWKAPLAGVTYSTPITGSDRQIVILSTGELVAFDATSGERRWWVNQIPYQPKSSPVYSSRDKTIYFAALSVGEDSRAQLSSFEKLLTAFDVNKDGQITLEEMKERKGPAGAFAQIDLNGDGVFTRTEQEELMKIADIPHVVAAVSAAGAGDMSTKLKWVHRKGVPNVASPLLMGGVLYLIKEGGIVTTLRPADGSVGYEGRLEAAFGALYSSPVGAGENLYIASQQGKVSVLKAGLHWEILAVNDIAEDCYATPALVGDRLFLRTASHLWCFRNSPL